MGIWHSIASLCFKFVPKVTSGQGLLGGVNIFLSPSSQLS